MMTSRNFRAQVVDPLVARFKSDPKDLSSAFASIWGVDAYGSHVAWERRLPSVADPDVEWKYKNDLEASGADGSWQFRVVRAISNAGKHAVRDPSKQTKYIMPSSAALKVEPLEGWLRFFSRAAHWGEQVIVDLDLVFDESSQSLVGPDGKNFDGPFIRWVPVFDILQPSIDLIERGP